MFHLVIAWVALALGVLLVARAASGFSRARRGQERGSDQEGADGRRARLVLLLQLGLLLIGLSLTSFGYRVNSNAVEWIARLLIVVVVAWIIVPRFRQRNRARAVAQAASQQSPSD